MAWHEHCPWVSTVPIGPGGSARAIAAVPPGPPQFPPLKGPPMSNSSSHHQKDQKNTSSGHGALGMGGQPAEDPRDLMRGGDGRSLDDDASNRDAVPGAFGSAAGAQDDAFAANSQAVGQTGGPGVADVKAALDKSGPVDPA